MNEKSQVAAFIGFFLKYVEEEVREVGYFPVSEEALEDAKAKWLDAVNW
jgi:phosphate transport system substrate-binding protein